MLQLNQKTKKKTRLAVKDIPTTTVVLRNHCRYRNRNQPNISPLSKHEKWCSIINSFMALEQLVLIFPIGWSHLFSAGIVSPIAITATAESPALGRHFVFTIQP